MTRYNDPYGFSKDVYYYPDKILGNPIQWFSESNCLFDFAGAANSQIYWDCIAYIIIDTTHGRNVFQRKDILYQYLGVYSYTSTTGAYRTVPMFKVVYPVD